MTQQANGYREKRKEDRLKMLLQSREQVKKRKLLYIEVVRVIAAYFVIFNHTGKNGFMLFTTRAPGSLAFWVDLAMSIFCRVSVPLFFCISGALMLGRENEPLKLLWRKKILRMILVLCATIFLYCAIAMRTNPGAINIFEWLKNIYTESLFQRAMGFYHLWYLYAYIAFLISLPFLRSLVQNLDTKYFYYMSILAVVFNGVIPICEYLFFQGNVTLSSKIVPAWIVSEQIVLYPCIGYFLEHRVSAEKCGKKIRYLWLINVACIALCCGMTYYKGGIDGEFSEGISETFHCSFVFVNCVTIFLTAKYMCGRWKIPQWLEKGIGSVGRCTFGIYLIHVLVMCLGITEECLRILLEAGVNRLLAVLLQCAFTMLVGYVAIWLVMKVPFARKLLGG